MKIRKSTLHNYFFSITGIVFNRGVAFLNSVVIARLLGPASFGEFALFQIVMILTWQITQAFDTTYVRYAKVAKDVKEKEELLNSSLFLKLCYAAIVILLSQPLSIFLAQYAFTKPEIAHSLLLALLAGSFLSLMQSLASYFQAMERFFVFSLINSIFSVAIFLVTIILFILQGELNLDILLQLILMIALLIGAGCLVFLIKKSGNPLRPNAASLKKTFSLSKWILGVSVVFFVFQRIDTMFLSRVLQMESIGIYFAATQIVMFIGLVSGPLSNVFLPMASTALQSKDSLKLYWKESMVAIVAVESFIILLIVLSPFILKIAYGEAYLIGAPALRILLLGWIFWIAYQPFSFLFYTLEDSRTRFILETMKLLLAFIFLYILVPKFGMVGAALSIAAAFFLNAIFSSLILWKKIQRLWSH